MHYRSLIWILRIIALVAFLGVLYFVLYTSPYEAQEMSNLVALNIIIFEAILFVFLSAIFSLLLFWIRRSGAKRAKNSEKLILGVISIRQGVLLSFCAIILLVLQSFNILTWWDGLLAVGAILIIELYFLVK